MLFCEDLMGVHGKHSLRIGENGGSCERGNEPWDVSKCVQLIAPPSGCINLSWRT